MLINAFDIHNAKLIQYQKGKRLIENILTPVTSIAFSRELAGSYCYYAKSK